MAHLEYRHFIRRGIACVIAGLISSAAFAVQASSLEDRYVEAESTESVQSRIGMWNQLLNDDSSKDHHVITRTLLRKNMIHDNILLYLENRYLNNLQKAYQATLLFDSEHDKIWSLIHIIHSVSDKFPADNGKEYALIKTMIDDVILYARGVRNYELRSHISYAIADVLTRPAKDEHYFKAPELQLVQTLIHNIFESRHRARIVSQYVELRRISKNVFPKSHKAIYKILASKSYKEQSLVNKSASYYDDNRFNLALFSLLAIKDKKARAQHVRTFFRQMMKEKEYSRALRVARKIDDIWSAMDAWSVLAVHYSEHGQKEQAKKAFSRSKVFAYKYKSSKSRNGALKHIEKYKEKAKKAALDKKQDRFSAIENHQNTVLAMLKKNDIRNIVRYVKDIEGYKQRITLFRIVAETLAERNDLYKLIHPAKEGNKSAKSYGSDMQVGVFEARLNESLNDNKEAFLVEKAPTSSIGQHIHDAPNLERMTYNEQTAKQNIPLADNASISLRYYENYFPNIKFHQINGKAGFSNQQNRSDPRIIVIEDGTTDLAAVYDELANKKSTCLTRREKEYVLNCPIVISHSGGLIIDGQNIELLQLSANQGAYIVTAGDLYIVDSKLHAWDTEKNSRVRVTYKDNHLFRPFISTWSRANLVIVGSEIVDFGYKNSKSYGLSISSGPYDWFKYGNHSGKEQPTGVLVNNSFRNMFFGFYSYEASNVTTIGNEYVDNIVYGIDPHDRSTNLLFAYNTVYGSHEKHGIIMSREVNDSSIIGNVVFENVGAGIMLDRDSNQALVYANTVFDNLYGGMTVYESDCGIYAANSVFGNKGAGIRIRNSYDLGIFHNEVIGNEIGLTAYSAALKADDTHDHRDYDLDPYDTLTAASIVNNNFAKNDRPMIFGSVDAIFVKNNKHDVPYLDVMKDAWSGKIAKDMERVDGAEAGIVLHRTCPDVDEPVHYHSCKFRKNQTLFADGQHELVTRIGLSACGKPVSEAVAHH